MGFSPVVAANSVLSFTWGGITMTMRIRLVMVRAEGGHSGWKGGNYTSSGVLRETFPKVSYLGPPSSLKRSFDHTKNEENCRHKT